MQEFVFSSAGFPAGSIVLVSVNLLGLIVGGRRFQLFCLPLPRFSIKQGLIDIEYASDRVSDYAAVLSLRCCGEKGESQSMDLTV